LEPSAVHCLSLCRDVKSGAGLWLGVDNRLSIEERKRETDTALVEIVLADDAEDFLPKFPSFMRFETRQPEFVMIFGDGYVGCRNGA
jgi:hypothetical protein